MAIGALGGAFLSALSSVASTALGNQANSQLNSDQAYYNERMWRLNNEYNTPANQMKRLREAGINPHFAISGGSLGTGNSSSPSSPISPQPYDFSPLAQGIGRSVELYQQKQLNDAEIDYKNSQAQNWHIKNITQLWRDYSELQNMIKSGKLTDQEIEVAKGQAQTIWTNLQSLSKMNEVNIEKIQSEKFLNDAKARSENAHASYQEIINRFAPEAQSLINSNLRKEGARIDSEVYKNDRQAALNAANEALSNAQRQGVRIDNDTKYRMADYIVEEKFAQKEEAKYRAGNEYKMYHGGRLGHELPAWSPDKHRSNSPVHGR